MNTKKILWLYLLFAVAFGAIAVLCLVIMGNEAKFRETAVETEAVITKINTYRKNNTDGEYYHDVYVKYTVDGDVYESRLNYWNSGMREGGTVKIYYDPDEPNVIVSDSTTLLLILSVSFGLVSWVFIVLIFLTIRKSIAEKKRNE